MVDSEKLRVSCQKVEEIFKDKNVEVFDTILLNETIEMAKNKLKIIKAEGSDTHGVFRSFYFFPVDQTPNCTEFVEWCANNYSAAEEVIINKPKSRIIFPIHASVICKTLSILDDFVHLSQEYKEENIIQFF